MMNVVITLVLFAVFAMVIYIGAEADKRMKAEETQSVALIQAENESLKREVKYLHLVITELAKGE